MSHLCGPLNNDSLPELDPCPGRDVKILPTIYLKEADMLNILSQYSDSLRLS
jgi:hypothetical protein